MADWTDATTNIIDLDERRARRRPTPASSTRLTSEERREGVAWVTLCRSALRYARGHETAPDLIDHHRREAHA